MKIYKLTKKNNNNEIINNKRNGKIIVTIK